MPHWSQAPWGVNKKCSAAVNILHFKCPVRFNIFNFECHATVDTLNFNWNHLQLKEVEAHTNVDWSIGAGHLKLNMSA